MANRKTGVVAILRDHKLRLRVAVEHLLNEAHLSAAGLATRCHVKPPFALGLRVELLKRHGINGRLRDKDALSGYLLKSRAGGFER